jgi:hypothetical protein
MIVFVVALLVAHGKSVTQATLLQRVKLAFLIGSILGVSLYLLCPRAQNMGFFLVNTLSLVKALIELIETLSESQ